MSRGYGTSGSGIVYKIQLMDQIVIHPKYNETLHYQRPSRYRYSAHGSAGFCLLIFPGFPVHAEETTEACSSHFSASVADAAFKPRRL